MLAATLSDSAPLAWIMGVSWKDAADIGNLLGTRLVLNEFVAFTQLGPMKGHLDPRSFTIATYALCGFANFSSIAIQIGGIGALAPNRKSDLARMGIRAVAAGGTYLDPKMAGDMVDQLVRKPDRSDIPTAELSERETEVVRLIALGHSNKEIASQLDLSIKTVETYKARSMEKLGIHGRVEIVQYASRRGWLAQG